MYARSWQFNFPGQIFPLCFLSPNQPDSDCRSPVRSPRPVVGLIVSLIVCVILSFSVGFPFTNSCQPASYLFPLHGCRKTHQTKRSHCARSVGFQVLTETPAHHAVSRGAQQDRSVPASHQALLNLPIPILRETPKHQRRTTVDRGTTCQAQEPDPD